MHSPVFLKVESLQSEWSSIVDVQQRSFFIVKIETDLAKILPLSDILSVFNAQCKHRYSVNILKRRKKLIILCF